MALPWKIGLLQTVNATSVICSSHDATMACLLLAFGGFAAPSPLRADDTHDVSRTSQIAHGGHVGTSGAHSSTAAHAMVHSSSGGGSIHHNHHGSTPTLPPALATRPSPPPAMAVPANVSGRPLMVNASEPGAIRDGATVELGDEDDVYGEADDAIGGDDEDPNAEDKNTMESELWIELDIDDGRDEPVLKAVVVFATLGMVYALWRAHCRGVSRTAPTFSSSGSVHHQAAPLSTHEEDWDDPPSPRDGDDFSRRTRGGHQPHQKQHPSAPQRVGWSLDIFSAAAERLHL